MVENYYNASNRIMKAAIITLLWLAVIGWAVIAFSSCSFQMGADGSKSFAIDGEMAARAILIFADK